MKRSAAISRPAATAALFTTAPAALLIVAMTALLAGAPRLAAAPPPERVQGRAGNAAGGGPACDAASALTLIGMDTRSGLMLFSLTDDNGDSGGSGGWTVQLDGSGHEARAFPERPSGRYGGSIGPGPVVAVEPCGAQCVQPVRWDHGGWQPLGEAVTLPAGATLAGTYDEGGAPWLMAHAAGTKPGLYQAWAYRLEGREWKSHGGLEVTAVGQPQVTPAPQQADGVVSGTGLFSAGAPPETWVKGLPGVTADRRGQILALGGNDAAYISADGVAYLSSDLGKSWRRSAWTPWGGGDTTGMWRQGTEYGIDLPLADRRGALQMVWYDRRSPAAEQVVLTRLNPHGAWAQVAQAPADVVSKNGERLPVTQVLVPAADSWVLLSGCAATAGGSGLVLRNVDKGVVSEPRFLPLSAAAGTPPSP